MIRVRQASDNASVASRTPSFLALREARKVAEGIATATRGFIGSVPVPTLHGDCASFALKSAEHSFLLNISTGKSEGTFARTRAMTIWAGRMGFGPPAGILASPAQNDAFVVALPSENGIGPTLACDAATIQSLIEQLKALHKEIPPVELSVRFAPLRQIRSFQELERGPLSGRFDAIRLQKLEFKLQKDLNKKQSLLLVHGAFVPNNIYAYDPKSAFGDTSNGNKGIKVRLMDEANEAGWPLGPKHLYFVDWHNAHWGSPIEDLARLATYAGYQKTQMVEALRAYLNHRPQRAHIRELQAHMTRLHIDGYVAALLRGDERSASHWQDRLFEDEFRYEKKAFWLGRLVPKILRRKALT